MFKFAPIFFKVPITVIRHLLLLVVQNSLCDYDFNINQPWRWLVAFFLSFHDGFSRSRQNKVSVVVKDTSCYIYIHPRVPIDIIGPHTLIQAQIIVSSDKIKYLTTLVRIRLDVNCVKCIGAPSSPSAICILVDSRDFFTMSACTGSVGFRIFLNSNVSAVSHWIRTVVERPDTDSRKCCTK